VLRATRDMLAMEIAYEPHVRQVIRAAFQKGVVVSTTATEKGKQTIDTVHPYHGLQYLVDKSIHDFTGSAQFLLLEKAEKEGYLTISIQNKNPAMTMPGASPYDHLLKDVERYYQPVDYRGPADTDLRKAWARERRAILEDALQLFLLPDLEVATRRMLRQQAQEVVVRESAAKLKELLETGPFLPPHLALNSTYIPPLEEFQLKIKQNPSYLEKTQGLEVVSVCLAIDRREPSFITAIDPLGIVRDFSILPATRPGPDGDTEMVRKELTLVERYPTFQFLVMTLL